MSVAACLGCGGRPVMRIRAQSGLYYAECQNTHCHWTECSGGALSRQGAEVGWNRSNEPNSEWVLCHWWVRCIEIHGLPRQQFPLSNAEIKQFNNYCETNFRSVIYAAAA
jgi:hypothetical protein